MKITPFFLLALILFSCKQKQDNPLEDKDFESRNYKFYFMGIQSESERFKKNYFLKSHPAFCIDNKEILIKIKGDLIENKKANISQFQADYSLAIVEESKGAETIGSVDFSKELILISGKFYSLSKNFTHTPEMYLKPLEKSSINLTSIKESKELLKLIITNNGAISARPGSIHNIMAYNGMGIIKARKDYLGTTDGINEETLKKVRNDLKILGDICISVSYCNDETYCTFYIFCEKTNSDAIPNEYEIIKPLSDKFEDKISVHMISLDSLKNDIIRNKLSIDFS